MLYTVTVIPVPGMFVPGSLEFVCPSELIEELFVMQCKPEDGALSHGLGDKGGHGLPKFNESLRAGTSRYRIVLVKRGPNARPRSR